jgi:hypothetical protein
MRHAAGRAGAPGKALAALLSFGVAMVVGAAATVAQNYRTDVFVPPDANECVGVPDCRSVAMPPVNVPAGRGSSGRWSCGPGAPHLWNWDVGQHEHIAVSLVAIDRTSVTVRGENRAGVPGSFAVSLGCSSQPYAGSEVLRSRHLAPTGWLGR